MAKLVLNIAMSLDGFIAREDDSYDWIRGHGTAAYDTALQFDNQAFLDSCDTVVMGRKAFEACAIDEIDYFKTKKVYVISRNWQNHDLPSFVTLEKDPIRLIKQLKKEEGLIWLFGGGQLVQTILEHRMIDHYIIGIIPILLGQGKPLFSTMLKSIDLKLVESTALDGIAMLRYDPRE